MTDRLPSPGMSMLTTWLMAALASASWAQTPAEIPEVARIPEAVRQRAVAATVRVAAAKSDGLGVIVGSSGPSFYILTAAHVVEGADTVTVEALDPGAGKTVRRFAGVRVLARTKDGTDLALLRLTAPADALASLRVCPPGTAPRARQFPALALASTAATAMGRCEPVTVAGRVKVRRPGAEHAVLCWEINRRPLQGDSGAALVDERGRVIGICSGASGKKGYFAHLESIHDFLRAQGLRWLFEAPTSQNR
ncbi:MAG: serine protease [Gemmataceae bacterium]|nr:serine protease [Gemmataceae bacterium]